MFGELRNGRSMPAFIWLLTSIGSSFLVLDAHLHKSWSWMESLCAAVPVGLVMSAWIVYLMASTVYGVLDARAVLWAWALQGLLGLVHIPMAVTCWRTRLSKIRFGLRRGHILPVFSLVTFFGFLSAIMASSRYLPTGPDGSLYSGGATWADLAIHLEAIASLLYGTNRAFGYDRFESPIYAGHRFVYPFLADLHSAALIVCGCVWRNALLWPTWLLAISSCVLIYLLNLRLTGSISAALISVGLVVWSGGTGAFEDMVRNGWKHAIRVSYSFDPIQADAEDGRREIFWFSYFGHVFLPQRPASYAMPLALVALLALSSAFEPGTGDDDVAKFLRTAAFLTALLPLFQAHAFLGLVIACGGLFLLDLNRCRRSGTVFWRGWMAAICIGAAVSIVQMPVFANRVTSSKTGGGFMRFSIRAVSSFNGGFWKTWVRALWLTVPLYFFGLIGIAMALMVIPESLRRYGWIAQPLRTFEHSHGKIRRAIRDFLPAYFGEHNQWRRVFLIPFVGVFFFTNICSIQPWVKDNIKLFYFWLFQASGLVGYVLVRIWRRTGPIGKFVLPPLLCSMFLSGILGMQRELGGVTARMFDPAEIALGEWIRDNTHWKSVFLTGTGHINPAGAIGGRTLYVGYMGWLWSHGLPNIHERDEFRNQVFQGHLQNGTMLAEEFRSRRISHILMEPDPKHARLELICNTTDVTLTAEIGGWRLYSVHNVILGDRPIEKISREELYFASGISLICLWFAALCMWHDRKPYSGDLPNHSAFEKRDSPPRKMTKSLKTKLQ